MGLARGVSGKGTLARKWPEGSKPKKTEGRGESRAVVCRVHKVPGPRGRSREKEIEVLMMSFETGDKERKL